MIEIIPSSSFEIFEIPHQSHKSPCNSASNQQLASSFRKPLKSSDAPLNGPSAHGRDGGVHACALHARVLRVRVYARERARRSSLPVCALIIMTDRLVHRGGASSRSRVVHRGDGEHARA